MVPQTHPPPVLSLRGAWDIVCSRSDIKPWAHLTWELSLKGAWDVVCSRSDIKPWAHLTWNSLMNRRLSCFSWRVLYRRTPSDDWAQKIGVNLSSVCSLCNSDGLFFSCPYVIELWSWILKAARCNSTRFTPPYLWSSLSSGCDKLTKQGMAVVFSPPFMSFGKPGMELDFQTNFLLNKSLEGFFGSS